jgi:hypothetical protein
VTKFLAELSDKLTALRRRFSVNQEGAA